MQLPQNCHNSSPPPHAFVCNRPSALVRSLGGVPGPHTIMPTRTGEHVERVTRKNKIDSIDRLIATVAAETGTGGNSPQPLDQGPHISHGWSTRKASIREQPVCGADEHPEPRHLSQCDSPLGISTVGTERNRPLEFHPRLKLITSHKTTTPWEPRHFWTRSMSLDSRGLLTGCGQQQTLQRLPPDHSGAHNRPRSLAVQPQRSKPHRLAFVRERSALYGLSAVVSAAVVNEPSSSSLVRNASLLQRPGEGMRKASSRAVTAPGASEGSPSKITVRPSILTRDGVGSPINRACSGSVIVALSSPEGPLPSLRIVQIKVVLLPT